jgi:hypothetical protein
MYIPASPESSTTSITVASNIITARPEKSVMYHCQGFESVLRPMRQAVTAMSATTAAFNPWKSLSVSGRSRRCL